MNKSIEIKQDWKKSGVEKSKKKNSLVGFIVFFWGFFGFII